MTRNRTRGIISVPRLAEVGGGRPVAPALLEQDAEASRRPPRETPEARGGTQPESPPREAALPTWQKFCHKLPMQDASSSKSRKGGARRERKERVQASNHTTRRSLRRHLSPPTRITARPRRLTGPGRERRARRLHNSWPSQPLPKIRGGHKAPPRESFVHSIEASIYKSQYASTSF